MPSVERRQPLDHGPPPEARTATRTPRPAAGTDDGARVRGRTVPWRVLATRRDREGVRTRPARGPQRNAALPEYPHWVAGSRRGLTAVEARSRLSCRASVMDRRDGPRADPLLAATLEAALVRELRATWRQLNEAHFRGALVAPTLGLVRRAGHARSVGTRHADDGDLAPSRARTIVGCRRRSTEARNGTPVRP